MGRVVECCHLVIVIDAGGWNGMDGYCTAHMPCPFSPTHVDAHANAMPHIPGCRLSSSTTSRASSIQETIHSKGRGGRRRLPLGPSWLPGRALFIKLNIGIDLDDLTIWPDLGCPGPALPLCIPRLRVGHVVCLPHRRTGKSSRRSRRWSATATGHGQCQCQIQDVLVPCRALPK